MDFELLLTNIRGLSGSRIVEKVEGIPETDNSG